MKTIVAILIIILIMSSAIFKIYIEKKKGAKCVGCPAYKNSGCDCSKK